MDKWGWRSRETQNKKIEILLFKAKIHGAPKGYITWRWLKKKKLKRKISAWNSELHFHRSFFQIKNQCHCCMRRMRQVLRRSLVCQNKVNDMRLSFCFPHKCLTCGWARPRQPHSTTMTFLLNRFPTHICWKSPASTRAPACFGSNPSSSVLMASPLASCSVQILIVGVCGKRSQNYMICSRWTQAPAIKITPWVRIAL